VLAFAMATHARAQAQPAPSKPTAGTAVQEIVVSGQRPLNETLIDRKVYAISQDLQATSGSAAEVLNNVPSVEVDADGNVTLRGEGSVTILVDGKPSAQFAGASRGLSLQQFPASEIDRIEVLANPPAQFKAEGTGGVINIITKKTHRAGGSGGTQLSLGDKRRFVFGLNGAYDTGKLRFSGGIGLRQDARERVTTYDRTALDPTTDDLAQSHQTLAEHQRRLIPSAKAEIGYDLSDSQSMGASFSHRELKGVRFFSQDDENGPVGVPPTSLSSRHSDGRDWSADQAEGLTFQQKLWRPGETLSLSLQGSANHERERYAYQNSFFLPVAAPTFDDLRLSHDLVKTEFSADYDLPLAHEREVKFGYDLEDDDNAFDNVGDSRDPVTGSPVVNPAVTNHFRYRQQVNAVYGEYQAPLGPWRLQTGLRVEAAEVSTFQVTGGIAGGRHDFAAFPNLHLTRDLGDEAKLSASLTRRINRPDPEALNPFADYQDTHNLRAGNPDLLPQDTWSSEVGYNGAAGALAYGATAYYRFDRNSVTEVVQPVSADVVLVTKANLPKSRSAGIEFTVNGKLGSTLTYGLSGDLFHSQIDATALGALGLRSTTGLNLKAHLDYRPTSVDTAQISVSRSDKRLTPQGEISAQTLVNLGYRRQLRPDLAAVVTVSDALDGQRFRRLIVTPQLRDDYLRHQIGRVAFVGLVYTFGGSKKGKPGGFDYEP
jgi:outer membrane cobalamin receptor